MSLQNLSSSSPFLHSHPQTCQPFDSLLPQAPSLPPTSLPSPSPPLSSSHHYARHHYAIPTNDNLLDCGCNWEKLEEAAKVIANVQHAFETTEKRTSVAADASSPNGITIDDSSPSARVKNMSPDSNYVNSIQVSIILIIFRAELRLIIETNDEVISSQL